MANTRKNVMKAKKNHPPKNIAGKPVMAKIMPTMMRDFMLFFFLSSRALTSM